MHVDLTNWKILPSLSEEDLPLRTYITIKRKCLKNEIENTVWNYLAIEKLAFVISYFLAYFDLVGHRMCHFLISCNVLLHSLAC